MKEALIKEAFIKVKDHISSIEGDISIAKLDLLSLKQDTTTIAASLTDLLTSLNQYIQQTNQQTDRQTNILQQQTLLIETFTQQIQNQLHTIQKKIEELQTIISPASSDMEKIFQQIHQNTFSHISNQKIPVLLPTQTPTNQTEIPADRPLNPTYPPIQTHIPTDNQPFYSLISSYSPISIGNQGVPTDKPTDRQTNQQTTHSSTKTNLEPKNSQEPIAIQTKLDSLNKASEILSSLDSLKKEIRLKFKRLTNQEILIFSTIYQLEEEGNIIDYPLIADTLALSESSVRDYVQKIIGKGIPIEKEKINNKKVLLSISKDLKKIASLDTILQLRDL